VDKLTSEQIISRVRRLQESDKGLKSTKKLIDVLNMILKFREGRRLWTQTSHTK